MLLILGVAEATDGWMDALERLSSASIHSVTLDFVAALQPRNR
jgi:hypothetical protein